MEMLLPECTITSGTGFYVSLSRTLPRIFVWGKTNAGHKMNANNNFIFMIL
jgi:hypothetical protein